MIRSLMWSFNRNRDRHRIQSENLHWDGPFSWPGYEDINNLKPIPNVQGVYLFTFSFNDGFLVYSAGITNSTKTRLKTHSREYRKGKYNVLSVDFAKKGEREEIWHGWTYAKEHKEEYELRKSEITKAVEDQLKSFRLFFAEVNDNRKRERIEASLMNNLYMSREHWADLADRGMALKGRYNREMPIVVNNHSDEKLYGVPDVMEI